MAAPRVIVLRAPGTNCDEETAFAFTRAGGVVQRVHLQELLAVPGVLNSFQVLCIPGGFSYGDDIGAGRIFADQLQIGLSAAIRDFLARDTLILGICNGFQVLIHTGLLVSQQPERTASLAWNDSGRFEDRWVHLQVQCAHNVFLGQAERLYLPVAHAEGKFIVANASILETLRANHQIALCYALPQDGQRGNAHAATLPYPHNPNGSTGNIAGLSDPSGRVLGLMPHPERYIDPTHHPRWTRFTKPLVPAGRVIFENAVAYFA